MSLTSEGDNVKDHGVNSKRGDGDILENDRQGSRASRRLQENGHREGLGAGFDQIDLKRLKAAGHPLRLRILAALAERGAMSPKQLSDYLDENLNLVAYHAGKVLYQECELLSMVKEVPRRGAVEHFYKIRPEAMLGHPEWQTKVPNLLIGDIKSGAFKSFLEEASRAAAVFDPSGVQRDDVLAWVPTRVSATGRHKIAKVLEQALESVREIAADDGAGRDSDELKAADLVIGIASFEAGANG